MPEPETTPSAHEGHDETDVSMSWGGYLVCMDCRQVLSIDNGGEVLWVAGDSPATARHYLGRGMESSGLTPGTRP